MTFSLNYHLGDASERLKNTAGAMAIAINISGLLV